VIQLSAAEDCSAGALGAGPGNRGGERGKGSSLPGEQPSRETLERKTHKRAQPFPPGQGMLPPPPPRSRAAHPWGHSEQRRRAPMLGKSKTQQAAAATWERSDRPRHDEPADPGSKGLADHADMFPFIIPGSNTTALLILPTGSPFPSHTPTPAMASPCAMRPNAPQFSSLSPSLPPGATSQRC